MAGINHLVADLGEVQWILVAKTLEPSQKGESRHSHELEYRLFTHQ